METKTARQLSEDYGRIAAAIEFLRANREDQPGLDRLARELGLSSSHLQRTFSRWAGISPKRFLQLLTLEDAKTRLARSEDLLSTALNLGLSGPSRLHDHFVSIEAVTPGEFKARGRSVRISYGFHPTPFGECLIGETDRGVTYLGFVDDRLRDAMVEDLRSRWPEANLQRDAVSTGRTVDRIFAWGGDRNAGLNLLVRGTNFQVQVWRALLRIPEGRVSSYADLAVRIGQPSATRAVGTAVGANPVAWLIPCHRVLRKDGGLGGYHWGTVRKEACLVWEVSRCRPSV